MAALRVPSGASKKQKQSIQMAAAVDGKYFNKPRGRPPKDKMWDYTAGTWVDDPNPKPPSEKKTKKPKSPANPASGGPGVVPSGGSNKQKQPIQTAVTADGKQMAVTADGKFKKPRGRPPKDKMWDDTAGTWVDDPNPKPPSEKKTKKPKSPANPAGSTPGVPGVPVQPGGMPVPGVPGAVGAPLNPNLVAPKTPGSVSTKKPTNKSQAELISELNEFINSIGGSAASLSGYSIGYTESRHFYASPGGKKFWTRLEVARHLGLKDKLPPKPSKAKKSPKPQVDPTAGTVTQPTSVAMPTTMTAASSLALSASLPTANVPPQVGGSVVDMTLTPPVPAMNPAPTSSGGLDLFTNITTKNISAAPNLNPAPPPPMPTPMVPPTNPLGGVPGAPPLVMPTAPMVAPPVPSIMAPQDPDPYGYGI